MVPFLNLIVPWAALNIWSVIISLSEPLACILPAAVTASAKVEAPVEIEVVASVSVVSEFDLNNLKVLSLPLYEEFISAYLKSFLLVWKREECIKLPPLILKRELPPSVKEVRVVFEVEESAVSFICIPLSFLTNSWPLKVLLPVTAKVLENSAAPSPFKVNKLLIDACKEKNI